MFDHFVGSGPKWLIQKNFLCHALNLFHATSIPFGNIRKPEAFFQEVQKQTSCMKQVNLNRFYQIYLVLLTIKIYKMYQKFFQSCRLYHVMCFFKPIFQGSVIFSKATFQVEGRIAKVGDEEVKVSWHPIYCSCYPVYCNWNPIYCGITLVILEGLTCLSYTLLCLVPSKQVHVQKQHQTKGVKYVQSLQ